MKLRYCISHFPEVFTELYLENDRGEIVNNFRRTDLSLYNAECYCRNSYRDRGIKIQWERKHKNGSFTQKSQFVEID